MSNRRTSRRPRGGPFNRAVRKSWRPGDRWRTGLALAFLATIALSQIDLDAWMRTALDPAAMGAELRDTGLRGTAHVIDGDTLDIHGTRIRISGIDAPESKQICQDAQGIPYACGADATQTLIRWIGSQTVTCITQDQDRYGRMIAQCSVAGADLGAFMVSSGHALAYRRFSTAYIGAETRARSVGLGMWQGTFIAPWDWRRGQR